MYSSKYHDDYRAKNKETQIIINKAKKHKENNMQICQQMYVEYNSQ